LRLLHVELGGRAISAGQISAEASNAASPHTAALVVTPAALDGTTYGQQTVTPSSSPATVPSGAQTVTIPGGLASLTGPTFALTATDGTTVLTSAVLKALGSLTVGPLPVSLDATAATLTNTAQVGSTQASAEKSVVLGGLSLPSVADLLDALNVDPVSLVLSLTKANLDKLNALIDGGALTALNSAVDSASAAVGAGAPTTWVATDDALNQANDAATAADSDAAAANAAFTAALTTLDGITPLSTLGLTTGLTPTQYEALASGTNHSRVTSDGLIESRGCPFEAFSNVTEVFEEFCNARVKLARSFSDFLRVLRLSILLPTDADRAQQGDQRGGRRDQNSFAGRPDNQITVAFKRRTK